jgi:hypothetical protein
LTLFLAWQNRKLKDELAELQKPQLPPEALKQGDLMETLTLLDQAGNGVTIEFGARRDKTLLLIFSPECPACAETLPIWSEMFVEPLPSLRLVGLRMGPESEEGPSLPFTIYIPDERGSGLAGKIPFVPTTLLVDGKGVVEQIWYGVLQQEDREELQRRLAEI